MQEWRDKTKQVWLFKKLFWWQTSPFDTPQEEHPAVKQRPADAIDYLTFRKASLTFIFWDMETERDSELRVFCPIAQNCASISSSFKYTHPRNHPISRNNIRIILLVTSPVLDDLHEGRTQIGDEFFRFTGTLRRHLLLYKTFAWNTSAFLNKNIYIIYNIYISYCIYKH